jgi:hypothetical protein
MATNRDLLKEAIADAKAVKEMAIANAKAALEESFTPQLKSMLSAKLQEMEEEYLEENNDIFELEEEINEENDLDLDGLLNELNEEDEMESEEDEMESEEDEMESEKEGEPLNLEDMTDEDLKELIQDVFEKMMDSGEIEAIEGREEMPEEEEGDDIEDEEEINIDELLAEMELFEEDDLMYEEEDERMEESLKDRFKDLWNKLTQLSGLNSVTKSWVKQNKDEFEKILALTGDEKTEAANTFLNKFESFASAQKLPSRVAMSDRSEIMNLLKGKTLGGKETAASSATYESLQTDLDEALATIETLRQDLNEVNLLNAKLLYTNKIFKAKNNLTENQKVKVLNMFDKAATVKETKLVYETLSEGLKDTRNPIKESLGMASKIMGTTNSKQPILESDPMVSRFQKLAGII